MSDSRQIVALNIGSSRITMGVFARNGKKLTLNRYSTRFLDVDPTSNAPRLHLVSAAVAEMAAELGVKGGELNYSISGQDVFIRFIKLPPITNADIGQLVTFEAQQQIPFPLSEIVWDYHLLPQTGGEQEVVIVAIKADALNSMNDEFMGLKFKTGKVDSSAISLYNAYKDSYPNEQEPVMIIDIGAKTTDIIYAEADRFFTRSVSAAGVFVTSAVARDMGLGFADAEQLKTTRGMVSMTNGQMEGQEADVAALATSIRNAMTRVASEIQRTTNHYRAQMNGSAPVKAYLCGGGASLPYTKEFLEERLGIPVSFFNPMHGVGVGKQINVEALSGEALHLGCVIGSALSAVGRGTIAIDLEPTVVGLMREASKKFPKVVAGMIIAVIGAGVFAYTTSEGVKRAEKEQQEISAVESKGKRIEASIRKDESTIRELDDQLMQYSSLTLQRYGYIDIIKKFVDNAHSDSYWIVDFDPIIKFDMENRVGISGTSSIKDTFNNDKQTSLVTVVNDASEGEAPRGRRGEEQDNTVYVNAIRLRGFGLISKGGEKIAQEIKDKVASQGEDSLFTFKNKDGVELETNQVLVLGDTRPATTGDKPFATPFTLILPLKTPLPVTQPAAANE